MSTTVSTGESGTLLTYNGRNGKTYELDVSKINDDVKFKLMARGFTHVLGSEVASKVISQMEKDAKENGALAKDEEDANKEEYTHDYRADFVEAMLNGEFATSTRGPSGPRLSSFEAELNRIVGERVRKVMAQLVKNGGAKWIAESKTWELSNGSTRTLDEAIENFKNSPAERNVADMVTYRAQAQTAVDNKNARMALATADVEI